MAQYLMPINRQPFSVAPSLVNYRRGVGTESASPVENGTSNGIAGDSECAFPDDWEPGNPTVIPDHLLRQYHFAFLIRHPRSSVPSYYRCTVPPLDDMTGFSYYEPKEAGYKELRALFDYLVEHKHIGPQIAGSDGRKVQLNGTATLAPSEKPLQICVVDADDLLDNPYGVIEEFCKSTGIDYSPDMLKWDDKSQQIAKDLFDKWKGFHEDALDSRELKPRTHVSIVSAHKWLLLT
jgi:hypothetical protein